jgi:hypothetical protein
MADIEAQVAVVRLSFPPLSISSLAHSPANPTTPGLG